MGSSKGGGRSSEERAADVAAKISACAEELKCPPCDLGWHDFQVYARGTWGGPAVNEIQQSLSKLGGYRVVRDHYFPPQPTDQAVVRARLRDHANINRRLGREAERGQFMLDSLERLAPKIFKGRIEPGPLRVKAKRTKRVVTLVLSDLHFGSDLQAEETGALNYGRVEEARRLAQVVLQAVEYKPEYRGETELRLIFGGDMTHGGLHDPRDGAVRSEQICRAIHLLSQAVGFLALHFKRVSVHCVTGNHGRDLVRHPGRATVGKWDSHETVIYSAVRMCCSKLKNVTFSIPKKPYDTYEDFGRKVFVTHGDGTFSPGNPGKAIQTSSLELQANRINSSLKDAEEYQVFICGHVHTPCVMKLGNGAWIVVNGALIPVDNYCVSLGILESACAQTLFESVEGHPVGDLRLVSLDASVDRNAALDKIIVPWQGY